MHQISNLVAESSDPACKEVKRIAQDISLMTMNNEKLLACAPVAQDDPFVYRHSVLALVMARPPFDIVVSQNQMQPALLVELVQQIKDATVRLPDFLERPAFPKLVPITNLNVGKAPSYVVLKCSQKHFRVRFK